MFATPRIKSTLFIRSCFWSSGVEAELNSLVSWFAAAPACQTPPIANILSPVIPVPTAADSRFEMVANEDASDSRLLTSPRVLPARRLNSAAWPSGCGEAERVGDGNDPCGEAERVGDGDDSCGEAERIDDAVKYSVGDDPCDDTGLAGSLDCDARRSKGGLGEDGLCGDDPCGEAGNWSECDTARLN